MVAVMAVAATPGSEYLMPAPSHMVRLAVHTPPKNWYLVCFEQASN